MSFSFDDKRDPRGPSEERSTRGDRRRQLLNDLLHQFDDQYHSMFSGGNYFKKGFPFDDDDDVEFGGLAERLLGRKRTAPPHAPVPAQPPPNLAREQQRMQEDSRGRRPQQNNHLPQHGLRNTVDIGAAAAAAGASGNQDSDRGQRSWSAPPPDNRQQPPTQEEAETQQQQQRQPPQSQRFVSRLNIPMNTSQKPAEYSTEQTQPKPQVQQSQQNNVRHIPIFVEGRDQPVYPKDNNKSSAKPPRPQTKQQQQQQQQHQQSQQQQSSPPVQEPSPSPPPPPPVNPVQQKLEYIMDELNRLANEIKALPWPSLREDKAYIYIDEMLTRCLIQLDCLETGGDDNLRLARRELVRRTQCCISELEARLEPPPPDMTAVLVGPIAEPQVQLKRPKKTDEPMDTNEENKAVLLGPVAQPQPQIQRPKNGKTEEQSNEMTAVLMGPVAEPQPQVIRPKNEAKTEAEKNESQQSVSQATVKS